MSDTEGAATRTGSVRLRTASKTLDTLLHTW